MREESFVLELIHAKVEKIVPRVDPAAVAVVEFDPDRVISNRLDVDDAHVLLALDLDALARAVAMVMPAEGPSLGMAPSGTCRCRSTLR